MRRPGLTLAPANDEGRWSLDPSELPQKGESAFVIRPSSFVALKALRSRIAYDQLFDPSRC
jgi:hypothetical protein